MLYAVIPAGGSGTRLWPLSRAGHPKFLHALTGSSASLLQATVGRLSSLASADRTYVVTGAAHAAAVARQLPEVPDGNILVEPSPRDSCAAIGLAASVIAREEPHALMGSFAADHLVRDVKRFTEVVSEAMTGAQDGLLMTIGIAPTHPETGYGYLQCGEPVGRGSIRWVEQFTEKPDEDVAKAYLTSGRHLWNAGMFVWRVDAFLSELARQQPDLHAGLAQIAAAWTTPHREEVLGEIWPTLPKISIDYAVMEGAAAGGNVATVQGDFGWTDVGDFQTLGDSLAGNEADNVVVAAGDKPAVLLRDAQGLVVVPRSNRLVAALGVSDLVIVDTADVVLICARERAQEVKLLVDDLKRQGDTRYT